MAIVADPSSRWRVLAAHLFLIALLAVVRKLMILDLTSVDASQLFALAATVLALGGVYWLVRDQDRRERKES